MTRRRKRILVTGSRRWTDRKVIRDAIMQAAGHDVLCPMILHGNQKGADTIAGEVAAWHGFPELAVRAHWAYYGGKEAGPIRNDWLLELEPDIVLAFPMDDSKGTWDTVNKAKALGIPVTVQHPEVPSPQPTGDRDD